MSRDTVVMALSGGMDSATVLGEMLNRGYNVLPVNIYYGSKHNPYERDAARNVVGYYKRFGLPVGDLLEFDTSSIMGSLRSALTVDGWEVPEGHYNDQTMSQTVVPGRNLIFLSILAALAESTGARYISVGVHQGDHHIYPDCRPEFIKAADSVIYLSSDRQVEIIAPFLYMDKEGIIRRGISFTPEVPYSLTRTCYKPQPVACGKCGACIERREAFSKVLGKDLVAYEEE